jgi:hypothetical protein
MGDIGRSTGAHKARHAALAARLNRGIDGEGDASFMRTYSW